MAADGGPPAQNLDNLAIHGPNKIHSVIDLFNPSLVEITVQDKSQEEGRKMTFKVPKGLICRRSEYFNKLFNGHFIEATNQVVELDDVRPRTFQVFIGWLYCRRLFTERVPATSLNTSGQGSATTAAMVIVDGNTSEKPRPSVVHDECIADSQEPLEAATRDASIPECKSPANDSRSSAQQSNPDASDKGAAAGAPGVMSFSPALEIDWDPNDPVTWPWPGLFKCFVFADKYDTRDMRLELFIVIQTKWFAQPYARPAREEISYAANNLPASSPLFRFLADAIALHPDLGRLDKSAAEQMDSVSSLPSEFLAAMLVTAKRHQSALGCKECKSGAVHHTDLGHTREEMQVLSKRDPCYYHEHGEDAEEAARCATQWQARKWMFEAPQVSGSEAAM